MVHDLSGTGPSGRDCFDQPLFAVRIDPLHGVTKQTEAKRVPVPGLNVEDTPSYNR